MFCKSLEATLTNAFTHAKHGRHEFLTVEHLMFALLNNPEIIVVFDKLGVKIKTLSSDLSKYIDKNTTKYGSFINDTQPSPGFQRVLQRAIFQAQSDGKMEVTGVNVLYAIYSEHDSYSVKLLNKHNMSRETIRQILSANDNIDLQGGTEFGKIPNQYSDVIEPMPVETVIEKYSVNLNERVRQGKVDPIVGRHAEMNRALEVLCRRKKNNPIFIGEAGVGKTAIIEGLVWNINEGKVPAKLLHCTIYSLDMASLLAGTKYRGDFEKRFKSVLNEFKKFPGAIIFIDEIHTIIGAGAASGGALDAANLLKPLLTTGEIKVIGATTHNEYRTLIEKDHALNRRFQKITVNEPSEKEAKEMLKCVRTKLEHFHKVTISDECIDTAVSLSKRFLIRSKLPDSAIDVLDETSAKHKIRNIRGNKVKVSEIEETIASLAQIPTRQVSSSDRSRLKNLERDLKTMVYGQDEAINKIVSAIKMSRCGLSENNKPVGSFLFTGPTGVGKTEVCVQLANMMGLTLNRFDMSEYMEKHTASQLIGAPAGYVGFDQGGLLTECVIKSPHCVLLLDEIEKAHDDIYNLLLQIMDHGTLTDNAGRVADFRHVIVIMTSNVGAELFSQNSLGFCSKGVDKDANKAVSKKFSPEFRNRLDSVVQFSSLDTHIIKQVVDKFISSLSVLLEKHNVKININCDAKSWLTLNGYNREMGARPMQRLINEKIKVPLSDQLLFGKLRKGGLVNISVENDKLTLNYDDTTISI
ncbi:MAG TPA: AAA family ATPase [Gammaproteobacteria bacterium]|nr:AAA family ATPase [Gammaproteobacteria bacterium]